MSEMQVIDNLMGTGSTGVSTWVDLRLTRGPIKGSKAHSIGILLQIKAKPELEVFMQAAGQDKKVPVDAYGDLWQNCGTPGVDGLAPLEVYAIDEPFHGRGYTLGQIALPLLAVDDGRLRVAEESINLSFLKLVGISQPNGVTIGITGPYSGDYLNKLKLRLPAMLKQFLQDHIVPVTINLQITSRG